MAILMLLDKEVYDIANNKIISLKLCPFADVCNPKSSYETWRKNRTYLKTNRTAERIIAQTGGAGTREAKRRLSLSDCFWIKHSYDKDTNFGDITPYKNKFSLMVAQKGVNPSSVPEIVLAGSQPKQWERGQDGITYMSKAEQGSQIHAEMLAVKLARATGVKSMNAFIRTEKGKVYAKAYPANTNYRNLGLINIVNITSQERSLIQFDQLGIGVDGYNPKSVSDAYKLAGVIEDSLIISLSQILFDCVIGNIDRKSNNSNWAVFLDHETGIRIPSWLYDFNWANLGSKDNTMVSQVVSNVKQANLEKQACQILEPIHDACSQLGLTLWKSTAKDLLNAFTRLAITAPDVPPS